MKHLIIATSLLLGSMAAYAGPFGLDMGTSLAELSRSLQLKPTRPFIYSTQSVPLPHQDFLGYRLTITPGHGLCAVAALSRLVPTSVYGTELARKFSSLEEALNSKYGSSKRYDFLERGSIWNEPREWMMALRKKERVLATFWTNEGRELPDNLASIALNAIALGTDKGVIELSYEFNNARNCLDWVKSQKDSPL